MLIKLWVKMGCDPCPGAIPTEGNILSLDFFHIVKPEMPILTLLPMLCVFSVYCHCDSLREILLKLSSLSANGSRILK